LYARLLLTSYFIVKKISKGWKALANQGKQAWKETDRPNDVADSNDDDDNSWEVIDFNGDA
ncbi:hypothetical protein, partial [Corallococcus sp. CA041A]|uniref:hypothetical protein n=1 Tax=Corallococcus sp. CA041A TaxID=2316727 RepID=UPI001F413C63